MWGPATTRDAPPLRVPNAAAFVENLTNEAMVITDPDNCIDMSHFSSMAAILAGDLDGDGSTGYSCNTGNARSIKRLPP